MKSYIFNRFFNKLNRVDLMLAYNDSQRLFIIDSLVSDGSKVITVYNLLPRRSDNLVKLGVGN